MTSKLRDFNLLKVADVSSNSTTNNNVSVVVNADTGGNSQTSEARGFSQGNNDVNFIPQSGLATATPPTLTPQGQPTTLASPIFPAATLDSANVEYASTSNQTAAQVQELEYRLNISENELKFYKLLSSTLSNILKDNNPKLIINLIDQSGKIIIEAATLIELIAIKTNVDPNCVNIQYKDIETGCLVKVSPIKSISNIKINNENFNLKFNAAYNILQDDFNISLEKVIIPLPVSI